MPAIWIKRNQLILNTHRVSTKVSARVSLLVSLLVCHNASCNWTPSRIVSLFKPSPVETARLGSIRQLPSKKMTKSLRRHILIWRRLESRQWLSTISNNSSSIGIGISRTRIAPVKWFRCNANKIVPSKRSPQWLPSMAASSSSSLSLSLSLSHKSSYSYRLVII